MAETFTAALHQEYPLAKPDFPLMWTNFPDHTRYPTLNALHTFIGGQLAKNIGVPGFGPNGNTCAVRVSRALNYGGMPLSAKLVSSLKLNALTGADKLLYLFRFTEMATYLSHALGVSPLVQTRDFGTAFAGKRGIVAFTVRGWENASGHLALWDGARFKENDHDDYRGQRDDPATPLVEDFTTKMTLWAL